MCCCSRGCTAVVLRAGVAGTEIRTTEGEVRGVRVRAEDTIRTVSDSRGNSTSTRSILERTTPRSSRFGWKSGVVRCTLTIAAEFNKFERGCYDPLSDLLTSFTNIFTFGLPFCADTENSSITVLHCSAVFINSPRSSAGLGQHPPRCPLPNREPALGRLRLFPRHHQKVAGFPLWCRWGRHHALRTPPLILPPCRLCWHFRHKRTP